VTISSVCALSAGYLATVGSGMSNTLTPGLDARLTGLGCKAIPE
jgi:hypothetical protein